MAIPKAYQAQMQTDTTTQKADKAAGDRNNLASKVLSRKSRKLLNLHKKRRYLWLGLIYAAFVCFIKCSGIVEKWEANAYKIEFFGVSLSVGKKAEASAEKLALEKSVPEKPGSEKPGSDKSSPEKLVAEKPVADKSSLEKPASDATKAISDQKDKSNSAAGSGVSAAGTFAASGKAVSDATTAPVSAAKNQNVVTLETDGVGFDPLSTSSPKEVDLLLKLASRRQDIEKRESLLKERELALSVVEKQQKDKITELTKLKESIEVLLKKTDKNSQEQFTNLVKIYEGMKPKHAAQIFDRMDVVVLKDLIPLMSQKKVSIILDQMSVVKAKELSLVLIGSKNSFAKSAANAPKK
jgi:flagellar motility protein MotE (MotC chaperone)